MSAIGIKNETVGIETLQHDDSSKKYWEH